MSVIWSSIGNARKPAERKKSITTQGLNVEADDRTLHHTCSLSEIKTEASVWLLTRDSETMCVCVLKSTSVVHEEAGKQSCVHTGRWS